MIKCSSPKEVEEVFRSVNAAHRQEATFGSASVRPLHVHPLHMSMRLRILNIMQVEVLSLVHSILVYR